MKFLLFASTLWAVREPMDYGEVLAQRAIRRMDVLFSQNKINEALKYGEQFAARVQPRSSLYYTMGLRCNQLGQLERALAYYNKALELSPNMQEALYDRSEILLALGRYDEAEKDLKMAEKSIKKHWVIHLRLAEVAGYKKNKKALDTELRKAIQLGFDIKQIPKLGKHWSQWARDKNLERTIRQIISQYGNEEIWLQLIRY